MNPFQQAFHSKIQVLASLNESIVNSHFPGGSPRHHSSTSKLSKASGRPSCGPSTTNDWSVEPMTTDGVESPPRGPPTLRSRLPAEILEIVLSDLSKAELIPVFLANKSMYSVAIRLLYRVLVENEPVRCIALMKWVLGNPSLQPHVRVLEFNISNADMLTGNFYRLLRQFLQRLIGLHSLTLDLPKVNSPVWIFDGCSFALRTLSTSMQCSAALARFLDTQPNIWNLTLRGFQTDALQSVAELSLDIAGNPSALFTPRRNFRDFVLQPGSLPRLTNFNAIHAGPLVVAMAAKGRPVSVVSVPLFSSSAFETLDALRGGSVPLKRLSLISFDPNAPTFIFGEVARRFPALEALHIVVLLAEFNTDLLIAACPHFESFKNLKYITCVATSPEGGTLSEEQQIAEMWHEHCPTLQTIILPKGRVWFQTASGSSQGKRKLWACFDDGDDLGMAIE